MHFLSIMRIVTPAALPMLALCASPALADEPPPRVAVIQQLLDCRSVADSAARLTCFDAQVAALATAEAAQDIRIIDREQVREARRGLFGFSLGNLNLFGRGENEEAEMASQDIVQEIVGTLAAVGRNASGGLIYVLDNGQRWSQNDSASPGRTPHVGQAITIRRASLGSFMASVEGRPGIRVRRER